jgi:hypothetical protein
MAKITLTIEVNGRRYVVALDEDDAIPDTQPKPNPKTKEQTAELREVEAAILARLTSTPVSGKALARLTGYRYNSYFRAAIAELWRQKLIVRDATGYSLTNASDKRQGKT